LQRGGQLEKFLEKVHPYVSFGSQTSKQVLALTRHSAASRGVLAFSFFLASWWVAACRHTPAEPVSIAFIDPEWSHDVSARKELMDTALREFTKETGIQVHHLPAPEAVAEQLKLANQLLDRGTADVYAIDVVWPGLLNDKLLDLRTIFATEMAAEDPELLSNFSIQNRLVAVPFHTMSACCTTAVTSCASTVSRSRPKPGTNWRKWQPASRPVSAQRGIAISGATFGPPLRAKV